ncbi:MAG TPA: alkene reductase [Candidatus Saccharimonadales bacterium]|jgi:N-ethylmaleimide reductase|nr:alkene reductase [Candidatus Saccharimonadales bacterium]
MTSSLDLFSSYQLGSLKLSSRMMMAPMTRNRAGQGNVPTELMATYYEQRASAGLVVTEAAQVSLQGIGYPGTPGIHSDDQVAGWKRITAATHRRGGRIFLQLWHAGRISHPALQPSGALPVAPSAIAAEGEVFSFDGPQKFVTPRALEIAEIPEIVRAFAEGAQRAKAAGFDGVELHAANGYLVDQFLRDGTNKRTDAYGGGVSNRVRFLGEVTEAVAGVWGSDRVGVRLSPTGTFNTMSDSDPHKTFVHAASVLNDLKIGYLHVVEPVAEEPGPLGRVSPLMRARFRGTLVANGGYDLHTANAALATGDADMVSFGVLFLANPDLPIRFQRGGTQLNVPQKSSFYGGDHRGYTDYPSLEGA